MNLSEEATVDQLRELLAQCDGEKASYVLWVDQKGEVHVSPIPETTTPAAWALQNKELIRFRFETFQQGYGYVGPEAAQDINWVNRLFGSLTRLWDAGATGYRDHG